MLRRSRLLGWAVILAYLSSSCTAYKTRTLAPADVRPEKKRVVVVAATLASGERFEYPEKSWGVALHVLPRSQVREPRKFKSKGPRQVISGESTLDSGLQRVDATPTVRFPWRKYPFFTVNSSLGWRYTWWSESLAPVTREQVPQSISRSYFDMQARIVGPVLNRIFNTPDSGYAEKIKHTIEPWVNLQRVTSIDLDNRIVRLDCTDYIVGGTTRITYGLNNRFYGKRKGGSDGGRSREILNVGLRQTYYTNSLASRVIEVTLGLLLLSG